MKNIFIFSIILIAMESPALADDDIASLQKQVAQQDREIRSLALRLEHMQDAMIQEHDERVAALPTTIQQPIERPRETASESWNRIERESNLQQAVVDAESNRDEIYWMKHKY